MQRCQAPAELEAVKTALCILVVIGLTAAARAASPRSSEECEPDLGRSASPYASNRWPWHTVGSHHLPVAAAAARWTVTGMRVAVMGEVAGRAQHVGEWELVDAEPVGRAACS